MDNIVKRFINESTLFQEILEDEKDSSSIANLMYRLRMALSEKTNYEELLKEANTIKHYEMEPNLQFLFLNLMDILCTTLGNQYHYSTQHIPKLLERLYPHVHPVVAAAWKFAFSNYQDWETFINENLKDFEANQSTSPRYHYYLERFASTLSQIGFLAKHMNQLRKFTTESFSNYMRFCILGNQTETTPTHHFEKDLLNTFNNPHVKHSTLKKLFLTKSKLGPLISGKEEINDSILAQYHLLKFKNEIEINKQLFAGKWKNALENKMPLNDIPENMCLLKRTRIRLELAKNNVKTAHLLLSNAPKNLADLMTNFYWAQIHLKSNNPTIAKAYMAKQNLVCQEYQCHHLLDFEFQLASYLNTSELRFLTKAEMAVLEEKQLVNISKNKKIIKSIDQILGKHPTTIQLKNDITKFAKTDSPILISGETGTGKELIAKAIHEESSRKKEPFIAINCASILTSILQSELFGHIAGAFTGANKTHLGVFEAAGKGTVFLDEIGEINQETQVALLRVLESNEVRPVGSTKSKPIQCRIITATNANLNSLVEAGSFRKDTYFRLKRIEIKTTALRERIDDIEILGNTFINQNNTQNKNPISLSKELINQLKKYHWPGNIRELKNEMEKMRLTNADKSVYEIIDCSLPITLPTSSNATEKIMEQALPTSIPTPFYLNQKSHYRRIQILKQMFQTHKRLTRDEASRALNVTSKTIGQDFKTLLSENFIVKIEPTKSPRTHYFIIKRESEPS